MIVLARWESKGRKYVVEAVQSDDGTFGFKGHQSMGYGYSTADAAMKRAELEAAFYPSKMRRTL